MARSVAALALILSFAANSSPALGQYPAVVKGRLVAEKGGTPNGASFEGARVHLTHQGSSKLLNMLADKRGHFIRVGVRPGRYNAVVECKGFVTFSLNDIEVENNARVDLVLRLTPLTE